MYLGKDALHLLEIGPAAAVEPYAAMAAVEQGDVEMLLQRADAVCDRGRGDAELGGGAHEALMAGRRLEEAQAIERGQARRGRGCRDGTL